MKKGFIVPYHAKQAETITFMDCLFVRWKRHLLSTSLLLPCTYTQLFCGLRGTSKVKSFSSHQTHLSMFLKFMLIRSAKAPALSVLLSHVPSLICWVFKHLNCFKPFLFSILLTDERLIPVCSLISLGDIWFPGLSSCEHIKSSTISSFSAVVAVRGLPKPGLLSINPFSLNQFKSRWTETLFQLLVGCSLHMR